MKFVDLIARCIVECDIEVLAGEPSGKGTACEIEWHTHKLPSDARCTDVVAFIVKFSEKDVDNWEFFDNTLRVWVK